MDGQSPQLDYAPSPPLLRRRWARWTIITLLILAASPFAYRWSRTAYELFRVYQLYRACASYTVPSTDIVYSGVPIIWATSKPHSGRTFGPIPPAWATLNVDRDININSLSTLFLHELRTPSGKRRLVGVDAPFLGSRGDHDRDLFAIFRVYEPASPLRKPRNLSSNASRVTLSNTQPFTLFAGQPDPSNPSHFTIAYTVNDQPGTIDGWLQDDDTVLLEPRIAPTTAP